MIGGKVAWDHMWGIAIPAQSVGNGVTVNGTEIKAPWLRGRQLSFVLVGGDHGAAATATCVVQGLRADDGTTWETLKAYDGVTDLAFTPAKLADGGALENGVVLGSIPTSAIQTETYKSVRLRYVRGAQAVACLVAASYLISDLYEHPGAQESADDLWSKTRPT